MQTFTGIQYLKIDIASNFGLDKATWDERLQWFEAHKDQLDELTNAAENPALYFAGVQSYRKACKGEASGYPISLDATSSGLQLLACLTGDVNAAQLCNVINYVQEGVVQRRDGYTVIYRAMVDALGEEGRITRDPVKKAVMTSLYGSKAQPKRVFGEGELLNVFYDTMQELAPAAWELNETMPAFWNPEALEHCWVLPDNFHVHVKVMDTEEEIVHFMNEPISVFSQVNRPTDTGRSLGANSIHSVDGLIVREMTRRCNYSDTKVKMLKELCHDLQDGAIICGEIHEDDNADMVRTLWAHYERTGYLSARIIDHLWMHNFKLVDHCVIRDLLMSLPAKPFQIMSIHDCFRCLPNYGDDLRRQYNLQLQLIAKSKLLEDLLSQITQRHIPVKKMDDDMWKQIADSEYALS